MRIAINNSCQHPEKNQCEKCLIFIKEYNINFNKSLLIKISSYKFN